MTPAERAELDAIARNLEALGLPRSAGRIQALLVPKRPDQRTCPMQEERGGALRAIPWDLAAVLYRVYAADGHGGQSLERLAERGGFGRRELGMLAVGTYGAAGSGVVRGYERRMPLLDIYELARESVNVERSQKPKPDSSGRGDS